MRGREYTRVLIAGCLLIICAIAACSGGGGNNENNQSKIYDQFLGYWESNEFVSDSGLTVIHRVTITQTSFRIAECYPLPGGMGCDYILFAGYAIDNNTLTTTDGLEAYPVVFTNEDESLSYQIIYSENNQFWLGKLDIEAGIDGSTSAKRPVQLNFDIEYTKTGDLPDSESGATALVVK